MRYLLFSLGALALLAFMTPRVNSQSAICQSRNDTVETCEDGFTCAYSFTGADLYERFTMRVIASGNPNGEMSVIIFINGQGVTVREGMTEEGEALSWTRRSSGEGESFFRVANTNSNGDITVRFNCNRADTELSDPSDPGDDTIDVDDQSRFAVGDSIIVDPGGPNEEANVVVGFGSLVLKTPLQFAHAAGETVISIGPGPTSTASEPLPGEQTGLRLGSFPNPSSTEATVALTLDRPRSVSVSVYDALGRRVAVLHEGPLAAGAHTLRLDTQALPSGIYVVRAVSGSETVTRRFTLLR